MPGRLHALSLILVLGAGQIVALGSGFYLFAILGDPIARSTGIAPATLFALVSAMLLVQGVLGPASGRWIERWGARHLLLASNLIAAAGLATIGLAGSLPLLAAGMLLLGLGLTAGSYSSAFALAVDLFEARARGAITGIALIGGLGSSLGWLLTSAWLAQGDWRGACFGWAALHVGLCLPLVAWLAPARPPHAGPRLAAEVGWDGTMVRLAILFAGAWLVASCIGAHLPRLLGRLGVAPAAAVEVAAWLGVAAVGARLAELVLLRRASPLRLARLACLLHPAGALLLLGFGPVAAIAFVLGQGVGNGLLSVANGTLPLLLLGRRDYAVRCAMINTPAKLLQAAGPWLFQLVLAASPQAALALTSAICLVMLAATLGLRAPPRA